MSFSVQIEVLRQGISLLSKTVSPGKCVTVGPTGNPTVPSALLETTIKLLEPAKGGYFIHLDPAMHGVLQVGGRQLRVGEGLLHDPRPEPLIFGDQDRGSLQLGDGLTIRFIVHRQRRAFVWIPVPDKQFAAAMAATSVMIFGAAITVAQFPPLEKQKVEKRNQKYITRHAAVPKPMRPPPKKRLNKGLGGKAIAEGRGVSQRHKRHRRLKQKGDRKLARKQANTALQGRQLARIVSGTLDKRVMKALEGTLAAAAAMNTRALGRHLNSPTMGGGLGSAGGVTTGKVSLPSGLSDHSSSLPQASRRKARPTTPLGREKKAGLTREQIRSVVARGSGQVQHCYERELLTGNTVSQGRIILRWQIDARGRVGGLKIVKDTVKSEGLRRCVLKKVKAWRFPSCADDNCAVVFPFEFFARS